MLYLVSSDISARFLQGQLAHISDTGGFDVAVGTALSDPPATFDHGVDVHGLPFVRQPDPIADVRSLIAVLGLIRRIRPAIVNASTPKAGLIGMLAAWIMRVPQRVYVVRGLRFETARGVARQVLRRLERLTTACATDVIYNSRSLLAVAEQQHAIRPRRGVVLGGGSGNGIDAERFDSRPTRRDARDALDLPDDVPVIGFVGRLTRDKGIVDLVEAVESMTDRAVLLLVGDFEAGDPVPDRTRRLIRASAGIVHVPWVDDITRIYPAIDVLAFPSYREGLPNVPLEAQLSGVPVVAYAATGTVDALWPGGLNSLVPTGDADALAEALADRLRHRPTEVETTEAARWVAERFARPRIWNDIVSIYRPTTRTERSDVR